METRRFGGEIFKLEKQFHYKSDANEYAKRKRAYGWKARVIPLYNKAPGAIYATHRYGVFTARQ